MFPCEFRRVLISVTFLMVPPWTNFKFQSQHQWWKGMDEAWDIAFSGGCTNVTKQKKRLLCVAMV